MTATKETIKATADALGITMRAEFVPFSKSRNKDEKYPSLNWRVTLSKGGRDLLTTDYGAGSAYTAAYQASVKDLGGRDCIMRDEAVREECESGRAWAGPWKKGAACLPELADVLHSLVLDGEAIDHATYESWASELGYDEDSRKGEAIYRACLEIGLRLRAALGDDGLRRLREAVRDY